MYSQSFFVNPIILCNFAIQLQNCIEQLVLYDKQEIRGSDIFYGITEQLDARLTRRAVIYCGLQERRNAHIEVLNYASLLTR